MKTISKIVISLVLLPLAFASSAMAMQNSANKAAALAYIPSQDTKAAMSTKQKIQALFQWVNEMASNPSKIDAKETNQFFLSNVKYSVNGKLLASNSIELTKHMRDLIAANKSIRDILPMDQIIIVAGNQVAVTYRVAVKDNNNKAEMDQVTALITMSGNKIQSWNAVAAHMPMKM